MRAAALLALAALATGCAAPAATYAPALDGAVEVARFSDARALATDGGARLYVIDGGAVVVLDTLGVHLPGGLHGAGLDRLSDPVDLDPTNGLEWFVADAAGGRVLRISHDGRLLEDTAVPAEAPPAGTAPAPGGQRGRPVAIAAGPGGALFVAEASRGIVLRWDDASRRRLRAVGGADAGRGSLSEPVALATDADGSLAVADRGRGEAVVFDPFGSYQRALVGPGGIRAVAWTRRDDAPALLVTGPRAVSVFGLDGEMLDSRSYDLGREELVDVIETRTARWLLTPTRLLRVAR